MKQFSCEWRQSTKVAHLPDLACVNWIRSIIYTLRFLIRAAISHVPWNPDLLNSFIWLICLFILQYSIFSAELGEREKVFWAFADVPTPEFRDWRKIKIYRCVCLWLNFRLTVIFSEKFEKINEVSTFNCSFCILIEERVWVYLKEFYILNDLHL